MARKESSNPKNRLRAQRLKQFLQDKSQRKHSYALKMPGLIRLFMVALVFFAELAGLVYVAYSMRFAGIFLYLALQLLSLGFVLFGLRRGRERNYFTAWIIIILGLPGVGILFYLLWGRPRAFKRLNRRIDRQLESNFLHQPDPHATLKEIEDKISPTAKLQAGYLAASGFPLYRGQEMHYYANGETWFIRFFRDLAAAEKFILLEYFIIQDGYIWDQILEILLAKAAAGVRIYLLYDDLGCVAKLDSKIHKVLGDAGIRVVNFNPVLRYAARLYINYRNHQKIAVIDGKIGHLGGINLADEYANLVVRFGYWKDVALRIEGPAVQGLTATFLKMWATEHPEEAREMVQYLDATDLKPREVQCVLPEDSEPDRYAFCIPYDDGPITAPENPAEQVYRSLINTASRRLWISTPYFVVDNEMVSSLCRAARSGVDVRLVTPFISDKWYVHLVTRSHYAQLLASGCRVYEYTPGFIHAKTVLCDTDRCVTGSVNFDFRSFNLMFENAAYLYREPVIVEIEEDFEQTFEASQELTKADLKQNFLVKIATAIAKLFSPLM